MGKDDGKRAKENSKKAAENIRREKQKKLRADVIVKKKEKSRLKERTTKRKKNGKGASKHKDSRGNQADRASRSNDKFSKLLDKNNANSDKSKNLCKHTIDTKKRDVRIQNKSYSDSNKIYRWDSHQEQKKYDSEILNRFPRFDDPNYTFNNLEGEQLKKALTAGKRFQKISHFKDKFKFLTNAVQHSNLDTTKDGKLCLENNNAAKSFTKELKKFVGNQAKEQITDQFLQQVLGKSVVAGLGALKMAGDTVDTLNNERFLNKVDTSLNPKRSEKKLRLWTEVMAKAERVGNPYERMEVIYNNYKEYSEAIVDYKRFVLLDQKLGLPEAQKSLLSGYERKEARQGGK